eukprot:12391637-Alexandrium_andersonii.AAC.1
MARLSTCSGWTRLSWGAFPVLWSSLGLTVGAEGPPEAVVLAQPVEEEEEEEEERKVETTTALNSPVAQTEEGAKCNMEEAAAGRRQTGQSVLVP